MFSLLLGIFTLIMEETTIWVIMLSMILSLFLFIPAFLCGADLLCIQNINTELDSLSTYCSYKISKEGEISDENIALVNSFNIEIECRSSCNSNGIGDVMTYALIKSV